MLSAARPTVTTPTVRIRSVALPVEHGSWGFLFEPLVAGIAIAPSRASVWVVLLFIGAFLLRQPLKVVLFDLKSRRWLPQTSFALKFGGAYACLFSAGAIGTILSANSSSLVPLLLVTPFAGYQIYRDSQRNSRLLLAEILGGLAISSSIAVLALAGNFSYLSSFALWSIVAARLISSIFYVRNRLLLEKGKPFSRVLPIAAHVLSFVLLGSLAFLGLCPRLTVFMFGVLGVRSGIGLSPYRKKIKAMRIGVWEVIYGTLTALSLIIGYHTGY